VHEAATSDDHHVVDGRLDLGEHVAGHEHGAALPGQVAKQVAEPHDALRVEAVGGLVEDQDARVTQQRSGESEPLPHAEGEAADVAFGGTGQPDQLEDLVAPSVVHADERRVDPQVVACSPARVEARGLQRCPDDCRRPRQVDVPLSPDRGLAGVGVDQAEQHPQRGGLAGAVGAQEAGDPAGLDGEGQVVDGPHGAEALGEAAHVDGHAGPPPRVRHARILAKHRSGN
jgi:hypothetical protein